MLTILINCRVFLGFFLLQSLLFSCSLSCFFNLISLLLSCSHFINIWIKFLGSSSQSSGLLSIWGVNCWLSSSLSSNWSWWSYWLLLNNLLLNLLFGSSLLFSLWLSSIRVSLYLLSNLFLSSSVLSSLSISLSLGLIYSNFLSIIISSFNLLLLIISLDDFTAIFTVEHKLVNIYLLLIK